MSLPELTALAMLVALIAYTLTGGADFGGGVWDLLARGPRAEAQRRLIARIIAPIWEANHVWLIVVVVLLFVAFPTAYAAISTALHIPILLMLIGIVLRGAAFTFRAYGRPDVEEARTWASMFGIASLVTPIALGIVLGAVAHGFDVDPETGIPDTDFVSAWLQPFPIALGVLCLVLFAYLAAVYLTVAADDEDVREDFRRRALAAGVALAPVALLAQVLGHDAAPHELALHTATGAAAVGALAALWQRRYVWARALVVLQTTLIVGGWGITHYPWLIRPHLQITTHAAPASVLKPLLIALGLGAVLLLPAMAWLYTLFTEDRSSE